MRSLWFFAAFGCLGWLKGVRQRGLASVQARLLLCEVL